MAIENDAMQALAAHLRAYLQLDAQQVVVNDWPDVDKMRHSTMIYIVPDRIELEDTSTQHNLCRLNGKIYILVKRKSLAESLHYALEYWDGVVRSVLTDPSIGGSLVETKILAGDVYPAVLTNVSGVEIDYQAVFEREGYLLPGEFVPDEYTVPVGG